MAHDPAQAVDHPTQGALHVGDLARPRDGDPGGQLAVAHGIHRVDDVMDVAPDGQQGPEVAREVDREQQEAEEGRRGAHLEAEQHLEPQDEGGDRGHVEQQFLFDRHLRPPFVGAVQGAEAAACKGSSEKGAGFAIQYPWT
ncbi:hypothetical protein D3C87_1485560 [compost metagenome]